MSRQAYRFILDEPGSVKPAEGPSLSSQQMLYALNRLVRLGRIRLYEGTVPAKVKARRRAANRAARLSRRVNRNG